MHNWSEPNPDLAKTAPESQIGRGVPNMGRTDPKVAPARVDETPWERLSPNQSWSNQAAAQTSSGH